MGHTIAVPAAPGAPAALVLLPNSAPQPGIQPTPPITTAPATPPTRPCNFLLGFLSLSFGCIARLQAVPENYKDDYLGVDISIFFFMMYTAQWTVPQPTNENRTNYWLSLFLFVYLLLFVCGSDWTGSVTVPGGVVRALSLSSLGFGVFFSTIGMRNEMEDLGFMRVMVGRFRDSATLDALPIHTNSPDAHASRATHTVLVLCRPMGLPPLRYPFVHNLIIDISQTCFTIFNALIAPADDHDAYLLLFPFAGVYVVTFLFGFAWRGPSTTLELVVRVVPLGILALASFLLAISVPNKDAGFVGAFHRLFRRLLDRVCSLGESLKAAEDSDTKPLPSQQIDTKDAFHNADD
ncbi:hypothetical protein B0H19DRAFT_1386418 [Mycena capillaripes]|nr:hypothetical protein B0H19DRAFT_1386418 [Mycena capillaripes]